MSDDPYAERRKLTFEQAEGAQPLLTQLVTREVPKELRALVWKATHDQLEESIVHSTMGGFAWLESPWKFILCDYHVFHEYLMVDEYDNRATAQVKKLKEIVQSAPYYQVLGFIQFVLRHPGCPQKFRSEISAALSIGRAAYRILDKDTLIPITSETDGVVLTKAFADLATQELYGVRNHLRKAGEALTDGNFADSIRESIHSVESVARTLETSGSFNGALTKLQKSATIHPSLSLGFQKIYGYTSDEKGIRHPLLDDPSKVDEADAIFMIGACSAFISYLVRKSHRAGLLASK